MILVGTHNNRRFDRLSIISPSLLAQNTVAFALVHEEDYRPVLGTDTDIWSLCSKYLTTIGPVYSNIV